jgi:hypothetical protein
MPKYEMAPLFTDEDLRVHGELLSILVDTSTPENTRKAIVSALASIMVYAAAFDTIATEIAGLHARLDALDGRTLGTVMVGDFATAFHPGGKAN